MEGDAPQDDRRLDLRIPTVSSGSSTFTAPWWRRSRRRACLTSSIVIENVGSDAGYWRFVDGHWEHVGGRAIDAIRDVQAGLAVLRASTQLRSPGLAELAALVTKVIGPE
jgi:hypothetical protein